MTEEELIAAAELRVKATQEGYKANWEALQRFRDSSAIKLVKKDALTVFGEKILSTLNVEYSPGYIRFLFNNNKTKGLFFKHFSNYVFINHQSRKGFMATQYNRDEFLCYYKERKDVMARILKKRTKAGGIIVG